MDPLASVVAAAGAEAAKTGGSIALSIHDRLFGPIETEIGQQWLAWYRDRSVQRVIAKAEKKNPKGTLPPRLGAELFDKAQWASDEFVAEYLSGVLAGARSEDGDDDRGVSWTALIGRLSSDQLRAHYIVVRAYRDLTCTQEWKRPALIREEEMVFHLDAVAVALRPDAPSTIRALEALHGLEAEGLITLPEYGPGSTFNADQDDVRRYPDAPLAVVSVTIRGLALAMQAAGRPDAWVDDIMLPDDNPLDALDLAEEIDPVSAEFRRSLPFKTEADYEAARSAPQP